MAVRRWTSGGIIAGQVNQWILNPEFSGSCSCPICPRLLPLQLKEGISCSTATPESCAVAVDKIVVAGAPGAGSPSHNCYTCLRANTRKSSTITERGFRKMGEVSVAENGLAPVYIIGSRTPPPLSLFLLSRHHPPFFFLLR